MTLEFLKSKNIHSKQNILLYLILILEEAYAKFGFSSPSKNSGISFATSLVISLFLHLTLEDSSCVNFSKCLSEKCKKIRDVIVLVILLSKK